jgi:hypothetical protein
VMHRDENAVSRSTGRDEFLRIFGVNGWQRSRMSRSSSLPASG